MTQDPNDSPGADPEADFELAGYRVRPTLLRVHGPGGETRLEARAMQVLLYLAARPGQVVSRLELERALWPGRVVTEDAVTNAILKLRRALGDKARDPRVIETIPKSGYRLIGEVTRPAVAEPASRPAAAPASARLTPWLTGGVLALAALLVAWLWWSDWRVVPTASSRPLVVVFPFRNLGADPRQDYLSNGITADLLTDLSRISGLRVLALGRAFEPTRGAVAKARLPDGLEADYLIGGSVQRAGGRLRVNAQLFGAGAGEALWGRRFEVGADAIFSLQDELTGAVVAAMRVQLRPAERAALARRHTASVQAYEQYLRGVEEHGHRTAQQNRSARRHFLRAIELDPRFALALSGLALTHAREAIDGWTDAPARSLRRAAELVARAVRLDPTLPQVYFTQGEVALFQRRYQDALAACERALAINASYADAYALQAWILSYAGRPDQARRAIDTALRLNPSPTASYIEVLGEIEFVSARYRESIAAFRRVLRRNPNYTRARTWLAAALARAGDGEAADWEALELLQLAPDFSISRATQGLPFKDPRQLQALLAGLRQAGLPD